MRLPRKVRDVEVEEVRLGIGGGREKKKRERARESERARERARESVWQRGKRRLISFLGTALSGPGWELQRLGWEGGTVWRG
jgi:hypothetical protein